MFRRMKKRVLIAGDAETFRRYGGALRAAGGDPAFAASGEASLPDSCGALLLPGGGDWDPRRYGQKNIASRHLDPARDQWEWELLERFTAAGKPVLGVCRGMQGINVFFGGTLMQDIPENAAADMPGHAQRGGKDQMHPVFSAPGIFAALCGNNEGIVNSAHHQAVGRLGNGLRVEQWAKDGIVEAFRHETLPVWGVQWHPERLPGPAGPRLFAAFLRLMV